MITPIKTAHAVIAGTCVAMALAWSCASPPTTHRPPVIQPEAPPPHSTHTLSDPLIHGHAKALSWRGHTALYPLQGTPHILSVGDDGYGHIWDMTQSRWLGEFELPTITSRDSLIWIRPLDTLFVLDDSKDSATLHACHVQPDTTRCRTLVSFPSTHAVEAIAIHPEATWAALLDRDDTVRLWDLTQLEKTHELTLQAAPDTTTQMGFGPGSNTLRILRTTWNENDANSLIHIDVDDGRAIGNKSLPTTGDVRLTLSNGHRLVQASRGVTLLGVPKSRPLWKHRAWKDLMVAQASDDESLIAMVGCNEYDSGECPYEGCVEPNPSPIDIVSAKTGRRWGRVMADNSVDHITWVDNNTLLAVSDVDNRAEIINLDTGKATALEPIAHGLEALALSPTGERIAAITKTGWIHVRDTRTFETTHTLDPRPERRQSTWQIHGAKRLRFLDTHRLLVWHEDSEVMLYDLDNPVPNQTSPLPEEEGARLHDSLALHDAPPRPRHALPPSLKTLANAPYWLHTLTTGSGEHVWMGRGRDKLGGCVIFWGPSVEANRAWTPAVVHAAEASACSARFELSDDDRHLWQIEAYRLVAYDLTTGEPRSHSAESLPGKRQLSCTNLDLPRQQSHLVVSPGGHFVAQICNWQVILWDLRAETLVAVIDQHLAAVTDAAFSVDEGRLWTASADGTLRSWAIE